MKRTLASVAAFIGKCLNSGPYIWNFSDIPLSFPERIKIGGDEMMETLELIQYALQSKRNGDYRQSLIGYLMLLNGWYNETQELPALYARGLEKTLIASNEISIAASLLLALVISIEEAHPYETNIVTNLKADFNCLQLALKNAVEKEDYDMVKLLCITYSGNDNYEFLLDEEGIYKEVQEAYDMLFK